MVTKIYSYRVYLDRDVGTALRPPSPVTFLEIDDSGKYNLTVGRTQRRNRFRVYGQSRLQENIRR